jgi:hypothetical protein
VKLGDRGDQSQESLNKVIGEAVWWTQTQPENQNLFLSVDVFLKQRWSNRLRYATGTWQGQSAYAVSSWGNDAIDNQSLAGSAIELCGFPPNHFVVKDREMDEKYSITPSPRRGRPVRPVFYHRSGPVEYIWFNHGISVSAVLFANTLGKMAGLNFRIHAGTEAIHIRRAGKVIGMLWPNSYTPRHLTESARLIFVQ